MGYVDRNNFAAHNIKGTHTISRKIELRPGKSDNP